MKPLANLSNLRTLEIGRTQVDDAGMVPLAKLSRLQSLGIGFTAVGDHGLWALTTAPALRVVTAEGTKVTIKGAAVLRSRGVMVRGVPGDTLWEGP